MLHLFSPYPSYSSAVFICKLTKQTMHNVKWPIEHTMAIISQACFESRIALFDRMQGSRRNVTWLIGADKLEASYTRKEWRVRWEDKLEQDLTCCADKRLHINTWRSLYVKTEGRISVLVLQLCRSFSRADIVTKLHCASRLTYKAAEEEGSMSK